MKQQEGPKKNASSGRSLIIEWANQQDHWLRAVVKELLLSKTALTDHQIDDCYKLFRVEKELESGDNTEVPMLEDRDVGQDAEEALALAQIKGMENVNALAGGQELNFNPRLTVIFGENATGKSGYARILKGLAAVRTAESILSDIRKPQLKPKASVGYWLGGEIGDPTKAKTVIWNGQEGLAPLTRIDVFDSHGVSIHVDSELSYVYTPSDLSLFPLIADSIERVKGKLEKELLDVNRGGNQFTSGFNRQVPIYSKIEHLGASTDIDELNKIANVTKEEEARLSELESKVDALRADNTDALIKVVQTEKDWITNVYKCADSLSKIDVSALNMAIKALQQARDSYRKTTEVAFKEESIPGLAKPTWTSFIKAGEAYIEENFSDYPNESDRCVYCRQALSTEAKGLIKKYRDYCSDEAQKTVQGALTVVQTATIPLIQSQIERLLDAAKKQLEEDESSKAWVESIVKAANKAVEAKNAIEREKEIESASLEEWSRLKDESKQRLSSLDSMISDLQSSGEEKRKAFDEELQKLLLYKDRIKLREILPEVLNYVEAARWAAKANGVLSKFRGLSTGLTIVSKTASQQLLNQDFEKLFVAECESLKAPSVSLDFSGKKGQAARKKSIVSGYKLSDILSEGEQKVLALSDFIAESLLRRKSSPIVLDDPVNSLDYRRLKNVVNRIYYLSKTRQVIVFTHNIWFATELLERFRKDKGACSYYDIQSDGESKGLLSKASNPRTDTFKTFKTKIDELIRQAEKQTSAEGREALVVSGYSSMRGACEVFVETDLFMEVTMRYRANVMMTKLVDIRPDRLPEAIRVVTEIFDKCCDITDAHSHALETKNVQPKLDELKEEWELLKNARNAYLTKEKSA